MKNTPCSWIGRTDVVKISILPKAICTFNAIPIEIPQAFFRARQTILNFLWNLRRPLIAKAILKKKSKADGITPPDFKLCYNVVVIKTLWYWHKNRRRSMEKNSEPRKIPTTLWPSNLQQSRKDYPMKKDNLYNRGGWENWTSTCKQLKLDHFLTLYTKLNSK